MLNKMPICLTGEQTAEEVEVIRIKNESFRAGYEQCKKEMTRTSHNSDYAAALYNILDKLYYDGERTDEKICKGVEEIQRLNALYNHILDTRKKDN